MVRQEATVFADTRGKLLPRIFFIWVRVELYLNMLFRTPWMKSHLGGGALFGEGFPKNG